MITTTKNKQNKYETLDEKLKVNLEIVDGYKQQSSLLVKIIPPLGPRRVL